jgi:hypothetical protein
MLANANGFRANCRHNSFLFSSEYAMPSIRLLLKPVLLLCALAVSGSNAWSAVVENVKPRSRIAAKVKPAPVAAPMAEDDTPLNEAQLAVVPHVHAGDADCEFKSKVTITPNPDKPGRFRLQFGHLVYNMAPEPTTTGAVRLEDKQAGVVWLQIPSKSMLMNTKVGQRMVDSCLHAAQIAANATTMPGADGIGIGITATPVPTPVIAQVGK